MPAAAPAERAARGAAGRVARARRALEDATMIIILENPVTCLQDAGTLPQMFSLVRPYIPTQNDTALCSPGAAMGLNLRSSPKEADPDPGSPRDSPESSSWKKRARHRCASPRAARAWWWCQQRVRERALLDAPPGPRASPGAPYPMSRPSCRAAAARVRARGRGQLARRARPSQCHQGAHAARPVGGEAAPARGGALKPDAERVAHHTSRDAELAVVVNCTRRLAPPRKPEGPARSIS